MKNAAPDFAMRNSTVARAFLTLFAAATLIPAPSQAQADYYRHVIFDNSLTHDTY